MELEAEVDEELLLDDGGAVGLFDELSLLGERCIMFSTRIGGAIVALNTPTRPQAESASNRNQQRPPSARKPPGPCTKNVSLVC